MQRRKFITLLGGATATWPLAAWAQQPAGRVYRVGYLTLASREQSLPVIRAFDGSLRNLGWRVGENVVIEYRFGDNEKKMAADMTDAAKEMFEMAGMKIINIDKEIQTEGWSIHELGTSRMGNNPKTSVLNQFQQSHDVKNLLVVDGSSHVSASCQNPTWTIMALCWRSCDHLVEEFRRGNL